MPRPAPAQAEPQLTPEQQTYRDLEKFIERALERDRGTAVSIFAGTSDNWIATKRVLNEELRRRMGVSADQVRSLGSRLDPRILTYLGASDDDVQQIMHADVDSGERSQPAERDAIPNSEPTLGAALAKRLNDQQRDQLDLLYLNQEGLMAVGRGHLAKRLSLTPEQQQKIVELAKECWTNAKIGHQGIFTIGRGSPPGIGKYLEMGLRLQSMQLDQKVYQTLDAKQRDQLAVLVREAKSWEEFIRSPGEPPSGRTENVKPPEAKPSAPAQTRRQGE